MADEILDKRTWIEVFILSLIIALISWLIFHTFNQPSSSATDDTPLPVAEGDVPLFNVGTLTPIGIPPIILPSINVGNDNGCACDTCSVGGSSDPTIAQIQAMTQSFVNAIQVASEQTLNSIAQIGDVSSNGLLDFIVDPLAS